MNWERKIRCLGAQAACLQRRVSDVTKLDEKSILNSIKDYLNAARSCRQAACAPSKEVFYFNF
jgi:hypothetical protein